MEARCGHENGYLNMILEKALPLIISLLKLFHEIMYGKKVHTSD